MKAQIESQLRAEQWNLQYAAKLISLNSHQTKLKVV